MVSEIELNVITELDARLQQCESEDLFSALGGPTIIDLTNDAPPIFVSVLLHGDETSGWDAIREFVRFEDLSRPECSLLIYVGNVEAAQSNARYVSGQLDFNRIWCGGDRPEHKHAERVVDYVSRYHTRFALDIHNNSGWNPHYSVLTHLTDECMEKARHFSPIALYGVTPHPVITRRFNEICPSITIEVGLSNQEESTNRALDYLRYLTKSKNDVDRTVESLDVLETIANLKVEYLGRPNFETYPCFNPTLEKLNFTVVSAGTALGTIQDQNWSLKAYNAYGSDVTNEFLVSNDSEFEFKQDTRIAMFTPHPESAFQDCVCYFLKQLSLSGV